MRVPDALKPLVVRAIHLVALTTRATTLGVRIAVFDREDRVLLVRHTYVPGWYFPGGGVDRGEAIMDAAIRELREETGLEASEEPQFFGFYHNVRQSRRDHVALFSLSAQDVPADALHPNAEIAEARFFALEELPADITDATSRRLEEIRQGTALNGIW
ncbi:MAG: NUDIX domain-containing protein [Stappiaceae bacterium]